MAQLRAPNGCPWDQEQTQQTLLKYLLEESTELIEAVQEGDPAHIQEELGDVLLQVIFHAQIASEAGLYDIHNVIDGIATKLVRRHPHVFSNAIAEDPEAVTRQWDAIKLQEKEKQGKSKSASVLDKVSKSLPSLMRAQELQVKAAKVGFDWPDIQGSFAKVQEEFAEVAAELESGNQNKLAEEFGDLLFAMVNFGRHAGLDCEQAMIAANSKFERRFRRVENLAGGSENMKGKDLEELDIYWDQAKKEGL